MAIVGALHEPGAPLLSAEPEEVGFTSEGLARLSAAFNREIDRKRLPGAVALLARQGKIAYFEAFGVRDPQSGAPMHKDTIFRIYSMTKPMVSVAAMMLFEEGRLQLADPLAKYLPAFADMRVAVESAGRLELIPAKRPITVHDLLRHTSGLSYEFIGNGPVQKLYTDAKIFRRNQTNAEHAATLARLPLAHHPGTCWEYSRATDVLGHVIELICAASLGEFLRRRIIDPLEMVDTGFFAGAHQQMRLAEAFAVDPDAGTPVEVLDVRDPPLFESGGGGLVSTAMDYARFCHMLLNGGRFGRARLLGRKTIEFMTADHLGGLLPTSDLLAPGYGFGLGFSVRLQAGMAPLAGSVGHYAWGGLAGTAFWIDPQEELFAIMMMQGPGQREYFRALFRNLVYAALD